MNRQQHILDIAVRTLAEGKPFQQHVGDDGTPESGPCSYTYTGVRWGKVKLEFTPNGSVSLNWINNRCWPGYYRMVYSSNVIGSLEKNPEVMRLVQALHEKAFGRPHWSVERKGTA